MKFGTENRNKTIAAAVLGTFALLYGGYKVYDSFFADGPTPIPATIVQTVPVAKPIAAASASVAAAGSTAGAGSRPAALPAGNTAGVAATKMATSSVSLDPTLDQSAMLRTEHLVYSGSGRNIFSLVNVPAPAKMVQAKFPARPVAPVSVAPPLPTGPPPPPPINLKFFGTATRANGVRQAFLLQGEDVFLASQGDIVARRYRIVSISASSLQVEDMTNANTQTLPLQY